MNVSLNKLNTLREKLGRKPLKAWKESKTKLVEQIALLENESARVKPAAPAVKKATSSEGVRLADIARECKIDDRMARQKFRRLYANGGEGLPALIDDKWLFAEGDVPEVRRLLTTDQRKGA